MTIDLHTAALDTLAATPEVLHALLAHLPVEVIETPAEGGWSPKDVVAHLLITHQLGAIARIRTIAEHDDPHLENMDEEVELERSGYRTRTLDDLLTDFTQRRTSDVRWLRTLDATALQRTGEHSVVGAVTAEEFLAHAAYHDTLHLAQLTRMIGTHFEPHRGPMRVF